jgi:hypothetical protein
MWTPLRSSRLSLPCLPNLSLCLSLCLQDVLCYHNFQTGVKVLEHNMTKELFLEIVKANLTAEYVNSTKAFAAGLSLSFSSFLTHC